LWGSLRIIDLLSDNKKHRPFIVKDTDNKSFIAITINFG